MEHKQGQHLTVACGCKDQKTKRLNVNWLNMTLNNLNDLKCHETEKKLSVTDGQTNRPTNRPTEQV